MAAVGENQRSLLAAVQQAREDAHDEDVIDIVPRAGSATPEAAAGGAASAAAAESGSDAGHDGDDGDTEQDELDADAPGFASAPEVLEPGSSGDETDSEGDADVAEAGDSKSDSVAFAKGDEWEESHGEEHAADEHADDSETDEDDDESDGDSDGEEDGEGEAEGQAESEGGDSGPSAGEGPDRASGAAGNDGDGAAIATAPGDATEADAKADERGRRGGRGGRGGRRRRGRRGGRVQPAARSPREMPPIQEILQKGQEIVVQVIKDGIGTKGPTLTTYLSIPGRYVVLMPGINKRGVSRKVSDVAERERLKAIVRELDVPEGLGFIVRTAGTGATREDLQRDLDYLLRLWDQLRVRVKEHNAPVLLYQENDLVIRTLRDLYDGQGDVIIDDKATVEKARQFMAEIMPACMDKVQLYDGERPLFSFYNVEDEITRLLENRIELKSGGSLIIEQTEALVAIDVNSGRFKSEPGKGIDDTGFAVNTEAAAEIARQIRLRDLGGVVVIDFIDMRSEKHRKALENSFKEALRRDRARIKVARFSPFGIIELTRQRVRPSLKRTVHQSCPYCSGTGYIPSDETSCLVVVRTIRDNLSRPGAVLVVTVRPEVAEAVLNQQRQTLAELEKLGRKTIFIRGDHRLSYEDVEVRPMVALPDDMDHRRA